MSNQGLIIEERSRDIGDFLVGRLLPFREKRMVGPFIFIDHMGPSEVGNGKYLDIDPHPHIGLSTLTYLFEGEVMHRDSLGTVQRISPGSVNWMTGGHGVTHTERTPDEYRDDKIRHFHGFQIWVALPKNLEDMNPSFHHTEASDLPKWQVDGMQFVLVAGEAYGRKSPVPVHSPLFMIEIKANRKGVFDGAELQGEIGICIIEGELKACDQTITKGHMLVAKQQDVCKFEVAAGSHILVFGGEEMPEKRHIFWNYVSTDFQKIEKAHERWKNHQFPKVPGDDGYIVSPEIPEAMRRN